MRRILYDKYFPKIPFTLWGTVIAVFLTASDCSLGNPDPEPIPQTEILRIELTPDTVAVGDTVLIHCIIEDSLDSRFEFFWSLNEERKIPVNGTTTGPKIRWWASGFDHLDSGEVQTVTAGIGVDNGSEDSVSVTEVFQIPVIKE